MEDQYNTPSHASAADAANVQIEATEGPEGVSAGASPANAPLLTYGDADVLTPYSESDYQNKIAITVGARRESKAWRPETMDAGAFIASLCQHREGNKDGPAFVLGDMHKGQRLKTSVKALYGVGLDIDTGTTRKTVDSALAKLGCLAVRYSTHSAYKTKSEFKKDKLVKLASGREIDSDLVRAFLLESEKWEAAIADSADYIGTEHTEKGIVCVIEHAPIPKHRVVVLFADPFVIEKEGPTQAEAMRKWAKVPEALAGLLGVPFDTSCTDPSRLFYFPRHDKVRPFDISLFGGPYCDWRTLQLDGSDIERVAASLDKGKSKSVTDQGRALGRWSLKRSHGFQIADVIEAHAPDRIRHYTGHGLEIECPFDEDHHNPGDPEDRACLVVNATEGQSEFFTITCRHESCRNKTMLDMLGKMLADEWFGRDVLEDEQFNAIIEESEKPAAQVKIEKQGEARADYLAEIERLTPGSTTAEIEAVGMLMLELSDVDRGRAIRNMQKRTGFTIPEIKAMLKRLDRARAKPAQEKVTVEKESGLVLFRYPGSYNFDEAVEVCKGALLAKNKRDGVPTFSHLDDRAVMFKARDNRAEFVEVPQYRFRTELNKLVSFVRTGEKGDGAREPVAWDVAGQIWEQAYDMLPPAPEVVHTPFFLQDGSLCVTPKYHSVPELGLNAILILGDLNVPEVPTAPTEKQMQKSLRWLREELLSDFPFSDKGQREPSEANALGMVITPFVRKMVRGRTPLFAITKPDTGAGATFLAELSMTLYDGVVSPIISYNVDDAALAKDVVATIRETRSHLFFDDVEEFNSRYLLRMLTSKHVGGRELGRSKNIAEENVFNWILTGNNPQIGGEMHRRSVWIRLLPDRPLKERTFRHSLDTDGQTYEEFVQQNRGLAIHHLLTLVVYWQEKGAKHFAGKRLDGFDDWSAKIGGILEACGVGGFLTNGS